MKTSKLYDVIVVGELNVDIILNKLSSLPEVGKEKIAEEMSVVLGSSSAILASNLSTLGTKVGFIGKVGNDSFGELVINALKSKGVDTSLISVSQNSNTGATVVMSFDNDRANVTYPGAMVELTLDDIEDEVLLKARHLHFSSCFLQPGIKKDLVKLFKKAKALGLTTSLDPQWDPAENWSLDPAIYQFIDFFLPNTSELIAITKKETLTEALQAVRTDNVVIAKMGTKGACLYKNGIQEIFPAFLNKQVVDTVGAGDSFNAGLLSKYLEGGSIAESITFASQVAAISTTGAGGTGAFTDYFSVMELINNKFRQ
jgi:sugar/nucleoside kinase (ribokinase family)